LNDPHKRPVMITDYNCRKSGVDQMDENVAEFTCLRKTARWPLVIFSNILDVAVNNSFAISSVKDIAKQERNLFGIWHVTWREVSLFIGI
jgi:hypothetical protein